MNVAMAIVVLLRTYVFNLPYDYLLLYTASILIVIHLIWFDFDFDLIWNEKQTYLSIEPWASNVTISLPLAITLTLNFQTQLYILFYISDKMARLPRNEKQTYRLNARPQIFAYNQFYILPYIIFQVQICKKKKSICLQILGKWSDIFNALTIILKDMSIWILMKLKLCKLNFAYYRGHRT